MIIMQCDFPFDAPKAIEAILFLANRLKEPCKHSISKLLYFADREHLAEYGRLITGDNYRAIKYGPVPDNTLDLINAANNPLKASHASHEEINAAYSLEGYSITPLRVENSDLLSKSDIQCLQKSIDAYGDKDFTELTELSHDESWSSVTLNNIIPLMSIIETLPNSQELKDYLTES